VQQPHLRSKNPSCTFYRTMQELGQTWLIRDLRQLRASSRWSACIALQHCFSPNYCLNSGLQLDREDQGPRGWFRHRVSLAEGGSSQNEIDFNTLAQGTKDRTRNYAVSKAGTWMLCREWAQRYGGDGIVSVVQNPGNLQAGSYAGTPAITMFLISPLLHEAQFDTYTGLYAGLLSYITHQTNGAYIIPWGRIREDKDCSRKDIIKPISTKVAWNILQNFGSGARNNGNHMFEKEHGSI